MSAARRGLEPMNEEDPDYNLDLEAEQSAAPRREVYESDPPRVRAYSGASTISRRTRRHEYRDSVQSTGGHSRATSSSGGVLTALPTGYHEEEVPPLPQSASGRFEGTIIGRSSRSDDGSSQRRRLYLTDDDEAEFLPRRERENLHPPIREPSRGKDSRAPPPLAMTTGAGYLQAETGKGEPPSMPPVPAGNKEFGDISPVSPMADYLPEEVGQPAPAEDRTSYPPMWTGSTHGSVTRAESQSHFWTEILTIAYLIFFSIMGTLARLGVQWLGFYPGAPIVTPVVWANMAGSMVLGFLAEDERLFSDEWVSSNPPTSEKRRSIFLAESLDKAEKAKRKKTIPLYIGLVTGFCGSFTSFSSFARDFFLALSNDLPTPINHPYESGTMLSTTSSVSRHHGYSFTAWLAVIIYTVALSLGGLLFGAHAALALQPYLRKLPYATMKRFIDPLFILIGFGSWLGAILLAILPPDRPSGPSSRGSWANETWRGEVLFALVFAPIGCILRYYISAGLNPITAKFPLGTFAVNIFGTAVEAMCYDIQRVSVGGSTLVGGGRVGCQILQGVMDGFCGCLTTISTWVAEISSLRRKHGYIYALSSILVAFAMTVIIMGSVRWSVGWSAPMCNTGYPNKVHG